MTRLSLTWCRVPRRGASWRLLLIAFFLIPTCAFFLQAMAEEGEDQHPTASITPDEKVLFYYADPFANKVQIGSDFNGWDPSKTTLVHNADGSWTAAAAIREGRYGWKWVIDGQWENGDNHKLIVMRGKTGRLEVMPEQPTFNSPYNSRIYFSGRFYGQGVFRVVPDGEKTDTGRVRFAPVEYNLQPRLAFTAGDKVTGYMEVDVNAQEGRAQTNFSEGEALLTEDKGRLMLFRRRRIAEFTNPMRSLDFARNTLDDAVYFTTEERPRNQWFGRQFDLVRRYSSDDGQDNLLNGWQGAMGELNLGNWNTTLIAGDQLRNNENLWAARTQWTSNYFRVGATYVLNELARGLRASRQLYNDDNEAVNQNSSFSEPNGGRFFNPGTGTMFEYDSIVLMSPNGHNREQWWGTDIRVGTQRLYGFAELEGRSKEWAFLAYENGDGLRPDGGAHYFDGTHVNGGEWVFGGREHELTTSLGVVYFPIPKLGLELGYRLDDGTRLTMDKYGRVVEYRPSFNTWNFRGRYTDERFQYGIEALRRTTGDFPLASFPTALDNYDFSDVQLFGVTDALYFKQDLAVRLSRWSIEGGHRFRRYNIFQSTLESNELRGLLGFDLTKRVNLSLSGRVKSYSMPNDPFLTLRPGRSIRFYSTGARATYAISKYVNIEFGLGVNPRSDEDIEEGQLFFLREGLSRARRGPPSYGGAVISHTLDQVVEAERILSDERRMELNINAKF